MRIAKYRTTASCSTTRTRFSRTSPDFCCDCNPCASLLCSRRSLLSCDTFETTTNVQQGVNQRSAQSIHDVRCGAGRSVRPMNTTPTNPVGCQQQQTNNHHRAEDLPESATGTHGQRAHAHTNTHTTPPPAHSHANAHMHSRTCTSKSLFLVRNFWHSALTCLLYTSPSPRDRG